MRFPFVVTVLVLLTLAVTPATSAEGRKLALLVGVEKYDHAKLDNLEFCGDDVAALEKILTAQGFRCTLLRNEKDGAQPAAAQLPAAANINTAISKALQGVKKDDLILVVLTGRGLQPAGETQPFFCPQDANPSVEQDAGGKQTLVKPESMLGIGSLLKRLDQSGVGQKLVLVDACRNSPQPAATRRPSRE